MYLQQVESRLGVKTTRMRGGARSLMRMEKEEKSKRMRMDSHHSRLDRSRMIARLLRRPLFLVEANHGMDTTMDMARRRHVVVGVVSTFLRMLVSIRMNLQLG